MTMERIAVTSTSVASVGYDDMDLVLEVEFTNGAIYEYQGVPRLEFTGLLEATSKGHYIRDHIRDKFRFRRVQ